MQVSGDAFASVEELSLSRIIEAVAAARVQTVFTSDPGAARQAIVAAAEQQSNIPTVVSIHWREAPRLDAGVTLLLEAVAEAARSLWPRWYSTVEDRFDRIQWPKADAECRLNDARSRVPGVSDAWFRKAWRSCQLGRLPLVPHMSPEEQLRQLAAALDPQGPLVVLAVTSATSSRTRIMALGRAAEWLATQTRAPTLLLVPDAWRDFRELDCVNYNAVSWTPPGEPPSEVALPVQPAPVEPDLPVDHPRIAVEPAVGVPHPLSDVEQKLHGHLTADEELGPLFQFNMRVAGIGEMLYRVDLHWPEGRVVVEVDGPEHRKEVKYAEDRERDYRLFMAGFAVLRVTNSEVISNIQNVLEKIRNVVHHRSNSGRMS